MWFANPGNGSIGRIQAVVPPTVSGVSPGSGPSSGGTSITITGTRFVSGDTVEIAQGQGAGPSAIPATNVTVVSPTEITATTGGGAKPGPFHVFVTDNGATSAAGSAVFTYTVPVVSGVSPTSGSVNGGTVITITGQQFVSGASVQIAQGQGAGPSAIAATDVTVVSPTEITATTGGGAKPGPFHVFVTENGVTSAVGERRVHVYRAGGVWGQPDVWLGEWGHGDHDHRDRVRLGRVGADRAGTGRRSDRDRGDERDRGLADGDHRDDRRWG